jgi:nicotinamide-nucleotide amidase
MKVIIKLEYFLPGPPKEMEPMMDSKVIPYLKQFSDWVVYGEKLVVTNIGESAAEEMVLDIIKNRQIRLCHLCQRRKGYIQNYGKS